jgi:hypothetical protein
MTEFGDAIRKEAAAMTATSPPSALSAVSPPPPTTLSVEPWHDDMVDRLGHDPRSRYVETYWLGIIGPSTTLLFRHLADRFDASPSGFELVLADTAASLGLGMKPGRQGPFNRAIDRLCQFGLARRDHNTLQTRRHAPPLTQGQLKRLPAHLQEQHSEWRQSQLRPVDDGETKARRLALTLLELGESLEAAERQLATWHIDGPAAQRALRWATQRRDHTAIAAGLGGDAA